MFQISRTLCRFSELMIIVYGSKCQYDHSMRFNAYLHGTYAGSFLVHLFPKSNIHTYTLFGFSLPSRVPPTIMAVNNNNKSRLSTVRRVVPSTGREAPYRVAKSIVGMFYFQ
jgi:hypothetical protein